MIGNGIPVMLSEAKALAMRGWRVLPVKGKVPLVKDWPRLASTDDSILKDWWTRYRDANIGIATGPGSDLFVLDVDPGKGGEESLRSLEAQNGVLPPTIEVLTGGGGRHYYFHHPRVPLNNSAGQLAPGLDIKTEGGQVVAPPSTHPTTGRQYEWEAAHHPDDVPLAEVPTWLLQLLIAPSGRPPFVVPATIPDGQRNDQLFRLARALKAKGLSQEAILAAVQTENAVRCVHPLPSDEVEHIAMHAWTQPDRAAFVQNGHTAPPQDEAPTSDRTEEPSPVVAFQCVTAPDSFITNYIQYAGMRTDAPPDAHEAMAFGILSSLAANVRLPIATSVKGWRLVLWLLYLVNSTEGRKTTVLEIAVDLVRSVLDEKAILSWEGSPQGILQRLQGRDGQATIFHRDEYSGLMAGMNRGGHLATLPPLLIKGYDGAVLENIRTRKHGPDGDTHSDTDRVDNPYLVQFSAAPWDSFVERATLDNVLDGFIPRFNIVTGSAEGRRLSITTEEIRAAGTAVYAQAKRYYERAQSLTIDQMAISPAVLDRQWALEQAYRQQAEASPRPDAAGPSLKRLAETVLKLSALLALEDETGTVLSIREEHFHIAARITDKWVRNALRLVEALGRTTFQKDCEAVDRSVQACPSGMLLSTLYRMHRRLRERDFKEILGVLQTQERVIVESGPVSRGRTPQIVRPWRIT